MTFGFINPENLPPELREQFEAQQAAAERSHMEAIDRAHRVEGFVYGLDQDGLFALSLLLDQVLASGKRGTMFWSGQVTALLQDRHNVCAIHGVDHDAEALASLHAEGSTGTGDTPTYGPEDLARDMDAAAASLVAERVPEKMIDRINANLEVVGQQMDDYRLTFNEDTERFYCSDCGYMYPTIEDRMLKAPDDCPGCHQRAGQG